MADPSQGQTRMSYGDWTFRFYVSSDGSPGKVGGYAEVLRGGALHCTLYASPSHGDAAATIAALMRMCVAWCDDWEHRVAAGQVGPGTGPMPPV